MRFLLDTNIISEIEIGTSMLVLAEIRRGIELKRRRDPRQGQFLDGWFLQMQTRLSDRVVPVDEPIAEAWARIGIPNPPPLIDGLLAATAKVHGLTLITRNPQTSRSLAYRGSTRSSRPDRAAQSRLRA